MSALPFGFHRPTFGSEHAASSTIQPTAIVRSVFTSQGGFAAARSCATYETRTAMPAAQSTKSSGRLA